MEGKRCIHGGVNKRGVWLNRISETGVHVHVPEHGGGPENAASYRRFASAECDLSPPPEASLVLSMPLMPF